MRYAEKYTVTSHDVDVKNNMRPSLIIRCMQETANHQMRDRKPSYYDLFFQGKSFVLTRITLEVFEQIHQYEEVESSTWRCEGGGATFTRCFELVKDGKIMARAYSQWAVSDHKTGRLYKTSEVDISNYETDEPLDMNIPIRFRLPRDIGYNFAGSKIVRPSDVDMNLHMNNTHYPDMLWDFIPDVMEKQVTSVNIRFKREAALGEEVKIYMGKLEYSLPEDRDAEETYCFRSEVKDAINVEAEIGVRRLQE